MEIIYGNYTCSSTNLTSLSISETNKDTSVSHHAPKVTCSSIPHAITLKLLRHNKNLKQSNLHIYIKIYSGIYIYTYIYIHIYTYTCTGVSAQVTKLHVPNGTNHSFIHIHAKLVFDWSSVARRMHMAPKVPSCTMTGIKIGTLCRKTKCMQYASS